MAATSDHLTWNLRPEMVAGVDSHRRTSRISLTPCLSNGFRLPMASSTVDQDRPRERIELAGVRFDCLDEDQAIGEVIADAAAGRGGWACFVNLDVLRQNVTTNEVRRLFASADIALADGMPIVWASKLAGAPLPGRVAGSSMIHGVIAAAAQSGLSVFLLGGAGQSAEGAAGVFQRRHPDVAIVGTYSPPFGFEHDERELARIEAIVQAADPRIVFVGLGCPKQERLIARLRPLLPNVWFLSCGMSFSFVAGDARRAPIWIQRIGMEWLHRLVQEPRRLYGRYLINGIPFLLRLLTSALALRAKGKNVLVQRSR